MWQESSTNFSFKSSVLPQLWLNIRDKVEGRTCFPSDILCCDIFCCHPLPLTLKLSVESSPSRMWLWLDDFTWFHLRALSGLLHFSNLSLGLFNAHIHVSRPRGAGFNQAIKQSLISVCYSDQLLDILAEKSQAN